jgi:predicted 3-demethylubiquinone-9 3-methyltransferase (glyoxalase superfamily)
MQKIVPHLWYDKEAEEAAEFYASVFPESKVTNVSKITDTPSGDCDVVSFNLWRHDFMSISAGPLFKFNPSISFIVGCDTKEQVDGLWEKLIEGGSALMPLDTYPFSDWYGWVQDKYGVSWQLIFTKPEGDERPRIVPAFMFIDYNLGKAEEAINFYLSVFKNTKSGNIMQYGAGQEPSLEGTVMFADFMLEGVWLAAMDSAGPHEFNFNEAISLMVKCDNQAEIDHYWEKLSAVPESEQCGWLKDKYGVSWQIVPTAMDKMMESDDKEKTARVTQAFLKMKKFDIAELEKAANGKE